MPEPTTSTAAAVGLAASSLTVFGMATGLHPMLLLVGWLSGRDWQEEDSWFCSELVAWAFAQGGSPLFRDGVLSRVTPQNLWMIRP